MEKKKKLKIAVVIDVYNGSRNGGVISTRRFVDSLRKNHEVTVITSGDPEPDLVALPGFYVPFVRGIMKDMQFTFAWPVNRILRETFAKMDVVHVQFPFLLGIQSVKIARELGVPVVSSFLVQPENIFYNVGIQSKTVIDNAYRFFLKNVYNSSDSVICPSKFAESELKRFGLTVPSHVVSNGIIPEFRPLPCERDPRHQDRFVILSVGRFAREKGQDLLIRALSLSQHKDIIQLILIGRGPMEEKLIRMGRILPHPPVFLSVPMEELIRRYNTADLYVHPSRVELESLAVLEAIACGLPALISDSRTSASRQFALSEKFLFSGSDAEDLSRKIDYWVNHRGELKEAGKKYHELSKRYDIEESLKTLESVYSELSRRRENGRPAPFRPGETAGH